MRACKVPTCSRSIVQPYFRPSPIINCCEPSLKVTSLVLLSFLKPPALFGSATQRQRIMLLTGTAAYRKGMMRSG